MRSTTILGAVGNELGDQFEEAAVARLAAVLIIARLIRLKALAERCCFGVERDDHVGPIGGIAEEDEAAPSEVVIGQPTRCVQLEHHARVDALDDAPWSRRQHGVEFALQCLTVAARVAHSLAPAARAELATRVDDPWVGQEEVVCHLPGPVADLFDGERQVSLCDHVATAEQCASPRGPSRPLYGCVGQSS